MFNPFDAIEARLSTIETLLLDIKHAPQQETGIRAPATKEDAALYLGVSITTLDRLLSSGQLKSFRVGRQIRVRWEDLERLGREKRKEVA